MRPICWDPTEKKARLAVRLCSGAIPRTAAIAQSPFPFRHAPCLLGSLPPQKAARKFGNYLMFTEGPSGGAERRPVPLHAAAPVGD